ncbi:hypothetical protein F4778DRAFT_768167 [Xylariomycetidae sp. FL2044]|nr:hypothetical protein F4778DRAFT_768167 [Xylariomycetidae sp. FL2044]
MRSGPLSLIAGLSLASSHAGAARTCGTAETPATYQWRISDARYDGEVNGTATVAVSIVPGTAPTFYECVAKWPESWAGFYEDGRLVWSDCIWAGNGPTYDTAIAFALDLANQTMYITHTFGCSAEEETTDSLATGSIHLDMLCSATADGGDSCMLNGNLTRAELTTNTTEAPARLPAGSSCADNSDRAQSWQLEGWQRQYEIAPGSVAIVPQTDTGPSFTLWNMANSDVFECAAAKGEGDGDDDASFEGTCTQAVEGTSSTIAKFRFDPGLDMLVITQEWTCGDSSSFDAVGVAFVQGSCSRQGTLYSCTSDPLWVGTS